MPDQNEIRPEELADAKGYLQTLLTGAGWSFCCGGKPYATVLPKWRLKKKSRPERGGVVGHALTYNDPKTGLQVIVEIKEYTRFPVVEWPRPPGYEPLQGLPGRPCHFISYRSDFRLGLALHSPG